MNDKYQKKQNKYEDAKSKLPILLEILEDLEILESAFIFMGRFCPFMEHRCPNLSNQDGDGTSMSYAQRGHQFRTIGNKIIKNCRKIVFLTQKEHLPGIVEVCRKLIDYLMKKKTQDSKMYLDLIIEQLIGSLCSPQPINDTKFQQISKELHQFHDLLGDSIRAELPYFGSK